MQCGHCGTQVKGDFTVCAGCGAVCQKTPPLAILTGLFSAASSVVFLVILFSSTSLVKDLQFLSVCGGAALVFIYLTQSQVEATPLLSWRHSR